MKKNILNNVRTIGILILLIVLTRMIEYFPWWAFVIPVLVLGVIAGIRQWEGPAFFTGFLAGLLVWVGANIYFDLTLNNSILYKVAQLLSVSKPVVILISGVIGGLLTGLGFYTGKSLILKKEEGLIM